MDKELQGVLNTIIEKIDEKFEKQDQKINDLTAITLRLENNLTQKVESLFDGYKLTHEKQWELERKMEELERRLEALEIRTA